jgi:GTP cyclohydrolase I
MDTKRAVRGKAHSSSKVTVLPAQPIHHGGIEDNVRQILEYLGEDTEREGLVKTPQRVARAFEYLTKGYNQDPREILNQAKFIEEDYQEMVVVRDIDFYSMCVPSKQIVNAVSGAKPAREVQPGDQLWTLDQGYLRQTTVTRVTSRKTREMVEVTTASGRFRVTPDHPVMTDAGWREAQHLKPGTPVEWINPHSLCRVTQTPKSGYPLGYVLGATAADGSIQEGRRICLVVKDETFANKYCELFQQAFAAVTPVVESVTVPSGFLQTEIPMYRVRVMSSYIGEKFCRWLGVSENGSTSKTRSFQFPKVVTSSKEMMQGFLDGYCDGDGHTAGSGRFIISANEHFLQGLAQYLETPVAQCSDGVCSRIYVSNKWDQAGWYGKHGFRQQSDFYVPWDGTYTTVMEVKHLPPAKKPHTVYSITCEPYPTFLVGGHLTHNCEHHILPFFGRANVAYIPRHHIVGLSKIPRLVEVFSRRLQVQERLTTQVANTIMEVLDPLGVGVVIRAEHLCMRMRGVEKQNSIVTTSAMLGAFRTQQATREEFITLINGTQR